MSENSALQDAESARALAEYLSVNPYALKHLDHLRDLAGKHEHTAMGDNLKLAVALAGDDEAERATALVLLSKARPLSDAGVEACWELGWLAKRVGPRPGNPVLAALKEPAWYFQEVAAARPSPWQQLAADQLQRLKAATQPARR